MLQLDKISIERIKTLHPLIRFDVLDIVCALAEKNIFIRITQALRTFEQQDELYAQSRTKPGNKVTNTRGGQSWHNYGLAFDFCLLMPDFKNISWSRTIDLNDDNKPDWDQVVEIAKTKGFEWGGDWKDFKDYPHFQKCFGLSIKEAQSKYVLGEKDAHGYIKITQK